MRVASHQKANLDFPENLVVHQVVEESEYHFVLIFGAIVTLDIKDRGQWCNRFQLEQCSADALDDEVGAAADQRVGDEEVGETASSPMAFDPHNSLPVRRQSVSPTRSSIGPTGDVGLALIKPIDNY